MWQKLSSGLGEMAEAKKIYLHKKKKKKIDDTKKRWFFKERESSCTDVSQAKAFKKMTPNIKEEAIRP